MSPENTNTNASPLLPYEAPRVVEDLPLETYSLACEVGGGGKNPGVCDEQGGFANT
ncbi:MAG: hypothetical protein Q8S73_42375 [Deltaproteobacteria bacterium]|jgi:hypothetical protein|nr:hypothetical protein [Myxococcales bacterium]MDP3220808.1 hypothetical protein [Deltaproteobacteria bacterium]